jgi:hypothetical protein
MASKLPNSTKSTHISPTTDSAKINSPSRAAVTTNLAVSTAVVDRQVSIGFLCRIVLGLLRCVWYDEEAPGLNGLSRSGYGSLA